MSVIQLQSKLCDLHTNVFALSCYYYWTWFGGSYYSEMIAEGFEGQPL